jgi:hypothetical protein
MYGRPGRPRGALLGGLTGLVVAAAGSGEPTGISRRVALVSAAASLVLTAIAFGTGTHPVWAALAMAAVALVTSLAAAAGPLGAVLGFLGSLAYFLVATMARVANLFELVAFRWAGVAALAVVSLVVPDRALFSLGFLILLIGIGSSPAYPIPGGGLTTIGAILLAGAPTGDIAGWAGRRIVDVLVGCAIALVATYLFWPKDTENKVPVPAPT